MNDFRLALAKHLSIPAGSIKSVKFESFDYGGYTEDCLLVEYYFKARTKFESFGFSDIESWFNE